MSTTSYLARRVEQNHESQATFAQEETLSPTQAKANAYLMHHGIKGQKRGVRRAKWYPIAAYEDYLARGGDSGQSSESNSGRAKGGSTKSSSSGSKSAKNSSKASSGSMLEKYKQHKKTKANKKKMELVRQAKARKAEAKRAEQEAAKYAEAKKAEEAEKTKLRQDQISEAIRKGDKAEIQRLSKDMTNEQLDAAVSRMQKLKSVYEATYTPPAPKKIDKAKAFVDKSVNWVANDVPKYINAYNNIAGVVNSLNEDKVMPQIDLQFNAHQQQKSNQTSPGMEKVIRSGNTDVIKAYAGQMTDDELKRAANRVSDLNRLNGNNGNNNQNSNQQPKQQQNTQAQQKTYSGPSYGSTAQKKSNKDYTEKYTITAPKTSTQEYKKSVSDYNKAIKSGTMEDLYAAAGRLAQAKEADNKAWEKAEQKRVDDFLKKMEKKQKSTYTGPKYS